MALRAPGGRAVRVTAPAPGDADAEVPGVTVVAAILGSVMPLSSVPGMNQTRYVATRADEDCYSER